MPVQGVDVLAVLTEWDEFRAADLTRNKTTLAKPFVVDLRTIYPTGTMRSLGFHYVGVGRGVTAKVGAEGGLSSGRFAWSVWTVRARSLGRRTRRTNADRNIRDGLCGSDRSDLPR